MASSNNSPNLFQWYSNIIDASGMILDKVCCFSYSNVCDEMESLQYYNTRSTQLPMEWIFTEDEVVEKSHMSKSSIRRKRNSADFGSRSKHQSR